MSAQVLPSNDDQEETVSKFESPDDPWLDEDDLFALIDAINQNFVAEVDASHDRHE